MGLSMCLLGVLMVPSSAMLPLSNGSQSPRCLLRLTLSYGFVHHPSDFMQHKLRCTPLSLLSCRITLTLQVTSDSRIDSLDLSLRVKWSPPPSMLHICNFRAESDSLSGIAGRGAVQNAIEEYCALLACVTFVRCVVHIPRRRFDRCEC